EEIKSIGVPHTKVYNAMIYYGNALDALDSGKWKEAKDFFTMALKEDPLFILAQKGADSCPGAGSPGVGSVSAMSAAQFSASSEAGLSVAETSQKDSDKAAVDGGKGGGGH
ncbi:MAG: hypothetical protein QG578_478, partial [Thermodesulfobacteriota bacterium]|nr:hypothetical protein [Thermodesulfobacteriota bacterium]